MNFRVLFANSYGSSGIRARLEVDNALKKGGCKTTKAITDFLTADDIKFDIFLLPKEVKNGSMNSISDNGGETGNVAKTEYEKAGPWDPDTRKFGNNTWLERPTIFWNPYHSAVIYCNVKGTTPKGVTDFSRLTTSAVPGGDKVLVYRRKRGTLNIDKVVILAVELKLDPWIVLYHELGHMKQYFTLAKTKRLPAHDPALEEAWGNMACRPGVSVEPENLKLHENPITKFRCSGLYRERYYHDNFHFVSSHDGWKDREEINKKLDLLNPHTNFIFTNLANQEKFHNMAKDLPTKPPDGSGYYWLTSTKSATI